MGAPQKSRFDLSKVGEDDKRSLSAVFLDAVKRFYDDPANCMKFSQWQQDQSHIHAPAPFV